MYSRHLSLNWSQYSGNDQFDLKLEINIDLQNLYTRGKGGGKNRRTTTDKSYDILK